ncbi:kinase domain protein (macronuclear) [Tetrahymena thermophila SB210]|uniref:Kinase domain protein n=1 Tax=Tetrahymena thermophila (strain SB210) TaxID=312017 RepID=Q22S39_TETTS|nr:kinase domain protein [Tetrahymena thermophila SB210]EAR87933.2 kinase domain protein [Tetrahymena thermophila SB210]|eukprot:XP_001008178.2 kinase domain protein [Tetrahymena thermophila SB210]
MNYSLIISFLLSIILSAYTLDTNSNSENYVYSPLHLNLLTSSDEKWTPFQVNIAYQSGLLFVASGFNGITISDQIGSKILHTQNLGSKFVKQIQITLDGQFIFLCFENSLMVVQMIYNYEQTNFSVSNFTQLQIVEYKTSVSSLLYTEDEEFLIVACFGGLIAAYDTTNKSNLYLIGSINLQVQQFDGLFLSKNKKWLYSAANTKGVVIINLQDSSSNQQNNNLRTMNLIFAGYGSYGYIDNFCVATSDGYIYGIDGWQGFFLSNASIIAQSKQSDYPIKIQFQQYWPFQIIPTIQSITINKDETYIFLGVRSQGIYIFDIRDRENLKIFQQIKADSLAYSIAFSKNEEYLYLSNASSLLTFQRTEINLNDDFPNLFNTHQIKFNQLSNLPFKQKCYTDQSDSYLIGAFQKSIFVFPIHQNPYRLNVSDYQKYDIQANSIYLEDSGQYLIVPSYFSTQLLSVYQYNTLNYSNQQSMSLMNMNLIKQYQNSIAKVSEMITFSQDRTFAVQTYQTGLILYNSTDIFNMQIYCYYQYLDSIHGQNQGACITRDNQWVLSTVRNFGVYLLNVENKTNPILTDHLVTLGGENIIISESQNYAYLIDGFQGFAIIDINDFPKISIISRIDLKAYLVMGLPILKEQYILITQENNVLITLIDIRNKKFPYVVNTINYQSQSGEAVCIPQTQDHLFITTQNGIITIPIFSDVKIHTDVNLIINSFNTGLTQAQKVQKTNYINNQSIIQVNNEFLFQVGEVIQLNFNIIYPTAETMQISKIFFYQDGLMADLPSFFLFSLFGQFIQMNIDKSLLGGSQSQIQMNFILLWTVIPVDQTSFIFISQDSDDQAVTNSSQSALIYEYLQEIDILDSNNFLTPKYDFQQGVILNEIFQKQLIDPSLYNQQIYNRIMQQIVKKINFVLSRTCYINPFKFYVKSSLSFDNENVQQFISTIETEDITVILQVNSDDGKIVSVNPSSVTAYMSVNQDELKIEGSLENVNAFLQSKVIFSNNTQINSQNSPQITITIQDNVNYPLILRYNISVSNFIAIKKQLKLNPESSLQQQVENQFKDSVVDIESSIQISFSQKSFEVEDVQVLNYQYYCQDQNGDYILFPTYLWLQQQSEQLSFKGQTTRSMFGMTYRFKIVASDGYTSAEDYFYLHVNGIPYQYIINLLLKILGPIFALLGLYEYRSKFLNILISQQVTFSDEIIEVGQIYHKEIILLDNIQQISKDIIDQLFRKIQNQEGVQLFEQGKQSENNLNKQNVNYQQKNILENKNHNFNLNMLKQQKQQDLLKIAIKLGKLNGNYQQSKVEKRYLDNQGKLLFQVVLEDIKNLKIQPNKNYQQSYEHFMQDIMDTDKRMYRALRAHVSWQLLKYDKRTKQMYNYVKTYCLKNSQFNKNDWFKMLVQIKYQKYQKNQQNLSKDFPILELKFCVLFKIFESIGLFSNQMQLQECPNTFCQFIKLVLDYQAKINLYLLREVIFAETLGFTEKNSNSLIPSSGLSIHINSNKINQISAFKRKKTNVWQKYIFTLLNIEFTKYPMSKNRRLPSWISVDLKYGKIILTGEPQYFDSESIMIKILDLDGYCIYQYQLTVKLNQVKSNKKIINKYIDQIYSQIEYQDQKEESHLLKHQSNNSSQKKVILSDQYISQEDIVLKKNNSENKFQILNINNQLSCFSKINSDSKCISIK